MKRMGWVVLALVAVLFASCSKEGARVRPGLQARRVRRVRRGQRGQPEPREGCTLKAVRTRVIRTPKVSLGLKRSLFHGLQQPME